MFWSLLCLGSIVDRCSWVCINVYLKKTENLMLGKKLYHDGDVRDTRLIVSTTPTTGGIILGKPGPLFSEIHSIHLRIQRSMLYYLFDPF